MNVIEITESGEYQDQRAFPKKTFDIITSIAKNFINLFDVLLHRYSKHYARWRTLKIDKNSQGLFVFLHGLNGDPAQWHRQINILRKRHPNITLFAPVIHKRGNCSLEEATEPVFRQIQEYMKRHPNNPICLCGTSNGGRLALRLETKLKEQGRTAPVRVSNIAGVLFGTLQMNRFMRIGIAQLVCPEVVCEELRYGSPRAARLIQEAQSPLLDGWERDFYASPEDFIVTDMYSSLPPTLTGRKFVIEGESHGSLVSAVAEKQMNLNLVWFTQVRQIA